MHRLVQSEIGNSMATEHGKGPPLVAIVTPVYNGAAYLAETMESVQALDYPNLVHAVLDNASTDATPEIIARFRNRRVPLLAARNDTTLTMAKNWNAALKLTPKDASYFWLLCADDTLVQHAISRAVDVAESDPRVALVGCQWRGDNDGIIGDELPKEQSTLDGKEVMRSYLRREHSALSGMHVLVRRSLLDDSQAYYDESMPAAFDTEAHIRGCLRGLYGFVHEELAHWRRHAGSVTSTISLKMGLFQTDWPLLLDRYGPHVLGHREYLDCRKSFRRHYLRRLLVMRLRDGDKTAFDWHMNVLRARDDAAGWLDFADALAEWAFLALTRKRHRVGRPRRHARPPTDAREPLY